MKGLMTLLLLLPALAFGVEVKPEINGTYETACRLDANNDGVGACTITNFYSNQVTLASDVSYVTFQDIRVVDAPGTGMLVSNSAHHIVLDNIEVGYTAGAGLDFRQSTQQSHVKNSSFHDTSICVYHYRSKNPIPPQVDPYCESVNGPPLVELGGLGQNEKSFLIFENNDVYMEYNGELIGAYRHRGWVWIIGNRVREARRNGIYMSSSGNNIIENNIIWNFDSVSYAAGIAGTNNYNEPYLDYDSRALDVSIENYSGVYNAIDGVSNNIFRNNIIGGIGGQGLKYSGVYNSRTVYAGSPGASYYHNTVIGGQSWGVDAVNGKNGSSWNDTLEIVNNIVYSDESSNVCQSKSSGEFATEFVMGPNYWQSIPSDLDCRESTHEDSAYNDVIGSPNLALNRDSWNESNWTVSSGPTLANAVLQAGDSGLNAGRPLQAALSWLDGAEFDYFSDVTTCSFVEAEWEKQAAYDINCNLRSATTPNLGADETN